MLEAVEEQAGLGRIEGQLLIAEVADQVLGLAERGGVGVGGVLAGTPVGGPERAEQSLYEAATGETQSPAQQRPRSGHHRGLIELQHDPLPRSPLAPVPADRPRVRVG